LCARVKKWNAVAGRWIDAGCVSPFMSVALRARQCKVLKC